MRKHLSFRRPSVMAVAAVLLLLAACQRQESPAPGAAGTTASAPGTGMPAIPPASAPGTAAPSQPASAPGS